MRHSGVGTSGWILTRHNRPVLNLPRSRSYKLDLPGAGRLYQSQRVESKSKTRFVTLLLHSDVHSQVTSISAARLGMSSPLLSRGSSSKSRSESSSDSISAILACDVICRNFLF